MAKGYIIRMVTVKNPQGYTPYMQKTGELVADVKRTAIMGLRNGCDIAQL